MLLTPLALMATAYIGTRTAIVMGSRDTTSYFIRALFYGSGYAFNAQSEVVDGALNPFVYANGITRDLNSMFDPAVAAYVTLALDRKIADDGSIVAKGFDARTGQTGEFL